eukprot:6398314-Amphidinium_carterae.1
MERLDALEVQVANLMGALQEARTRNEILQAQQADWDVFATIIRAYCGALDQRLLTEMSGIMSRYEAMAVIDSNAQMSEQEIQRSGTLYYLLAMLLEGRAQAMLTNTRTHRSRIRTLAQ